MSDEPSHDPDEEAIQRRRAELARRATPGYGPKAPTPTACLSMPASCLSPAPHHYEPHARPGPCLAPPPTYEEIAARRAKVVLARVLVLLAIGALALLALWLATR